MNEENQQTMQQVQANPAPADTPKPTQSRWQSKVLWAALIAQLIAIGQITGLWAALGVPQNTVTDVAAAVLQLLALAGVVNDPTNGQGW